MTATQTAPTVNDLLLKHNMVPHLGFSLPDDWHVAYLADVAEIRTGLAKGKTNLKDSVELPYIRVANVQDGYFDLSHIKTIEVDRRDITRYSLQFGDVLITEGGDADKLGRGHIWHSEIEPCLHQNHIFVVRVQTEFMLAKFFAYYLGNSHGRLYFLKCAKQTTNLASINSSQLRKMPLPIPPLEEQARIVEILDAADAVVRATETLIDAKLRHKHALAEQLLLPNRSRFPEFAGQAWHKVRLGAFFREKAMPTPANVTPVVLSCSKIHGIIPQSELFSRQLASKDLSRYKYIEPGDLVFDPMLLWDASIAFSEYRGVVSPAYCTLKFIGSDADPRFFRYLFATHGLKHTYKTISQGTNTRRKKAPASDFLNIQVSVPSKAEQQRIAETLQLVDEEIHILRLQLDRHKQIKHGLMEQLLLGRVRVREVTP